MQIYLPCSLLAVATLLLCLTSKGVLSRTIDDQTQLIQNAITNFNDILPSWQILRSRYPFFGQNLIEIPALHNGTSVRCNNLDLSTLSNIVHVLEVAKRYTHFLEGPDYVFETNCAHFLMTTPEEDTVTYRIDILIHHLKAVMRRCPVGLLDSMAVDCTVIGNGDSAQFLRRIENYLLDARDFFDHLRQSPN